MKNNPRSDNNMTITISDGSSEEEETSPMIEYLPIIMTGSLFLICFIVLIASTIVSRRKKSKLIQKQNSIVESIVNSGANKRVKKEIEESLEEQRNIEILGKTWSPSYTI